MKIFLRREKAAILAVILFFCFPPESYSFYPFLKHSKFLKDHNSLVLITIFKDKKAHIAPLKPEHDVMQKYLLGGDGKLHEVKGKSLVANAKIDGGCGEKLDVVAFDASVKGSLMYVGKNSEEIAWYPAKEVGGAKPKCLEYKAGFKNKSFKQFELENLGPKLFLATWDNTKKKGCDVFFAEQVGLITKENKCTSLSVYERDCDGMAIKKDSLSPEDYIGMLKLGKEEWWLIFGASGHESSGFSALPFELGKPIDFRKSEELHPVGC